MVWILNYCIHNKQCIKDNKILNVVINTINYILHMHIFWQEYFKYNKKHAGRNKIHNIVINVTCN